MADFTGKRVLITGGGTGLGAVCAAHFAAEGANVAVMGRRLQPLEEVSAKTGALVVQGDASETAACEAAVDRTVAAFGGLDILVASAGIVSDADLEHLSDVDWDKVIGANLSGCMRISRAALKPMLKQGNGSIVLVSSVASILSPGAMTAYIAAKAGVVGLANSMAFDFGPKGIRTNAISPGWMKTPMTDEEMAFFAKEHNFTVEEAFQHATRFIPLKRMAGTLEIAKCVAFLAGDDSSYVNGINLIVDGGHHLSDVGYIALSS